MNLDVQIDQLTKTFLWPYFQTMAKPSVFFTNCRIRIKITKRFAYY